MNIVALETASWPFDPGGSRNLTGETPDQRSVARYQQRLLDHAVANRRDSKMPHATHRRAWQSLPAALAEVGKSWSEVRSQGDRVFQADWPQIHEPSVRLRWEFWPLCAAGLLQTRWTNPARR